VNSLFDKEIAAPFLSGNFNMALRVEELSLLLGYTSLQC